MTSATFPRPRNPRGEGVRLRAELLSATSAMLADGIPPEQISLRRVAEAVGVTAPSIYRHFENKEALLLAVVNEQFAELQRVLAEALERGGDDPFVALAEMGRAYVAMGRDRPAYYRVLFGPIGGAIEGLTGDQGEDAAPENFDPRGAFTILVELIERCLAAGPGGAGFDPFVVAVETWTFVHGLVDLTNAHPRFPWPATEEVLDSWAARFERAVRGGPPN